MRRSIFIENSEAYRQRALELRNRGITVNPHDSWQAMARARHNARNANVGPGTWDLCLAEARSAWKHQRESGREDYCRAVYPERYENFR